MKSKQRRYLIIALLLATIVMAGVISPALAKPAMAPINPGTTNLVSCWDLGETSGIRYDYTVSDQDLSDNNTVGYGTGKIGNAADFEVDNTESLSHADSAALSTGDIDFSFSGWIRAETIVTNPRVLSKRNDIATSYEYDLHIDSTTNVLTWRIGNSNNGETTIADTTTLSTATWYFFYVEHNASTNTIGISVNGSAVTTTSETVTIVDSNSTFYIGQLAQISRPFDGMIDEVMFYKRVLTADEISWLYNTGSGRQCSELYAATATPTDTATATNTATETPTITQTFTPSDTPTPTDTFTPSLTPTGPTPTSTDTPTPTQTFTPSATATQTPTPDATDIFIEYQEMAKDNMIFVIIGSIVCAIILLGLIVGIVLIIIKGR